MAAADHRLLRSISLALNQQNTLCLGSTCHRFHRIVRLSQYIRLSAGLILERFVRSTAYNADFHPTAPTRRFSHRDRPVCRVPGHGKIDILRDALPTWRIHPRQPRYPANEGQMPESSGGGYQGREKLRRRSVMVFVNMCHEIVLTRILMKTIPTATRRRGSCTYRWQLNMVCPSGLRFVFTASIIFSY